MTPDFVNPWALGLGAIALATPVLIHYLTRPRPARVPLSTFRFLRDVLEQRRAAHRLRDFVILALRTVAILLFALAIARPLSETNLLSENESATVVRVVIVDVSQSMAATQHGIRLIERARPLAAAHLTYRNGLKANLILAGARAGAVFPQPSTNFSALSEELNRAAARPERLDVQAALRAAGEMLAASPPQAAKELVVVSDFQRSNWETASFGDVPSDAKILFESVAPQSTPPNLAILSAACVLEGTVERSGRLEVEVANFTPAQQRVQATVTIGSGVYRLEGVCPAGGRTTLSQAVPLASDGWQTGEARLLGVQDALPADDARAFVVEVRPPPSFVLLSRQPAAPAANSSYYLERAILPEAGEGKRRTTVSRIDPTAIDREALSRADLLILDHPGKLDQELVTLINSLVRRGRALLYVVSEPMDAVNLKRFAEAAGSGLQMPVEFVPPPAGRSRRERFLTDIAERRAPFATFGEAVGATLKPLRFSGGLDSKAVEGGLKDDVLARYSDGSAALVTTGWGAGAAAVLNADLADSNLPVSAAFVPLVGELVNQLLVQRRGMASPRPGESFSTYLPSNAPPIAELQLTGGETVGRLLDDGSGSQWRMDVAPAPGVYEARQGDRVVFATAVTLPREESDLRPLASTVLVDRLAEGRQVQFRSDATPARETDRFWAWLAVCCVGCLLAELVALKWFRT